MKILLLALFGLLLVSSCKDDTVEVASIIITPSSPGATVGSVQQLTAIVSPEDASEKKVVWISSDPSKAIVNSAGLVTGVAKGEVAIIAAATDGSNVRGTVTIHITPKAASVVITPADPSVGIRGSLALVAAVFPAEAAQAVTWTTSDPSKVSVDASGAVTGIAKGVAVITAAATDGSLAKGTVTVTVTADVAVKATSVVITPADPSVGIGGSLTLAAAVLPADAPQAVRWTTSDPTKAAIDPASGAVTGIAKGTAVITAVATDGSLAKGTVTVTVTADVAVKATSVTITPPSPSVGIGGSLTLTALVLPAGAAQAVRWTSSNQTIATIDATPGVATGASFGTTAIIAAATDGSGIVGVAALTVGSSDASVSAIALGDENFNAAVPADRGTTVIANAPRAISSALAAVKVNITAATDATLKIGNTAFTQGQLVDFTNPVTFTVTAQDGTTVKNYTINIPAYNATSNPYGIYTVKHLVDVANGLTASYLLKNNIDLPNKDAADAAAATGISDYASAGWRSLGDANSYFTGTFDGGNFSINNFYANSNPGLFRGLGEGGIIKNLGVNATSGAVTKGGILAGLNKRTIDKCYATGSVSYFSFSSSSVVAGGLVGSNSGSISNSYATGSASSDSDSSSSYVGGLVGSNSGSISNSYATGSVSSTSTSSTSSSYVGGLVGSNSGSISNSYATGSVSSTTSSYVGGLVGSNNNSGNGSISISISNSYATGSVSYSYSYSSSSYSTSYVGGLVGSNNNSGNGSISISNSYATGSVSYSSSSSYSTSSVGGLVGRNKNSGNGSISISNSYATGSVSYSSSSSSYVGGLVGYNIGSISNSYATGNVSGGSAGGLVGSNGGSISNSYATGSVSTTTSSYSSVGGLAGINSGSISNSYATGSVSFSSSSSSSYSTSSVGGLVGSNSGSISNSYATGSVSTTTTSSYSSVGGLVGRNSNSNSNSSGGGGIGSISNSYATGNVSSSATDVSAKVGGLVGRNAGGTYTNCYRNSNAVIKKGNAEVTPDDASIEGITPKTKTDMQTDVFKGNLNVSGTVWGRSDAKNDKLPFIIGVGEGAGG